MELIKLINQFEVIIFDLGGVVIDLEYTDTIDAFRKLGSPQFDELYSQALQTDLFDRYETGNISSLHFINKLKELVPRDCSPNEVVAAWNAMIKEFQPEKLTFLEQLKSTHTIALLSNTNDLHEDRVRRKLKTVTKQPLEHYFHHTFLSHRISARKPHPATFIHVCETMNVQPESVLFIDDSKQHIEGAEQAGLATYLFQQNTAFR